MTLTISLLRPDDLLALEVEATNLRLDTSNPRRPRLVRAVAHDVALLIFQFPPQAIVEQAYFQAGGTAGPPNLNPPPSNPPLPPSPPAPNTSDPLPLPGAVGVRMTRGSRLVFQLPQDLHEIPYTIEGLLEWSRLLPVLPAAARVPLGKAHERGHGAPPIREPGPHETALELPYRLWLAPNVQPGTSAAWVHAAAPVTHADRVELWHTRLAHSSTASSSTSPASPPPQPVEASPARPVPVRVVWSPDFVDAGPLPPHATDDTPFRSPMSPRDRDQIVILSAGFAGYVESDAEGEHPYVPRPLQVERLFLSALGGWLTSRGAWSFPVSYRYPASQPPPAVLEQLVDTGVAALDLVEWDHRSTQGRDHYVRIVYEGFLYPLGHRTSLVKVTERKVHAPHGSEGNPADAPVAYLRQRMYLVVREREKTYPAGTFSYQGREMPFAARVRIGVHVTPDIDPPQIIGDDSFMVMVGGAAYPFPVTGRDLAGRNVDFLAPLVFVGLSEGHLDVVRATYAADDGKRRCVVRARNVAYADPAAGDTELRTSALLFTSQFTTPSSPPAPPFVDVPFLPVLDSAAVGVPALAALTGNDASVQVAFFQPYLDHGLDPHAGVFVQVVGTPVAVAFSADRSGGFARPNIALSALSARKGLVSGAAADAAAGRIDPAAYFGSIDAKLFGTVDLGQLIPLDATLTADAARNAPEVRTHAVPNRHHPTRLDTVLRWEPDLQDYAPSGSPVSIQFDTDARPSALRLRVVISDHLDGLPPSSTAHGSLTNFRLALFGVVALRIDAITFDSLNGAKSDVKLHLAARRAIAFEGPLQFLQTLADILPPGLFGGSGPAIAVNSTALRVSYTLGLPPIACGVFSLEHISITAGLDLPYLDGKPRVDFGFATRARPFLVTVEIFGGGGFVHLVLDADGVRMVEGAVEFGANFCLDFGVASGAVHAMAGIYFQLEGSRSTLTGFIDIGGEVSVLGIISVSIDLNLSLSWQHSPAGDVIQGKAVLTVSVHVLFFSASVQLSVERSFKAGGGDPSVQDVLTALEWSAYAGAFG